MSQRLMSKNLIFDVDELEAERQSCGYPEPIYRVNSVAKIFDVSRGTVKSWRDRGILPPPLRFNQSQRSLGWKLSDLLKVQDSMIRCER